MYSSINFKFEIFISGNSQKELNNYTCFHKILSPNFDDKNYIKFLKQKIISNKIDIIFFGINDELPIVSKNAKFFNCHSVLNSFEEVSIFYDKFKTYNFFRKKKINTPTTHLATRPNFLKIEGEIVLKKRTGSGSKKIKFLKNSKLLKKNHIDYIIQEFLPGDDFTAFFFKSREKTFLSVLKRVLLNGQTIYAEFFQNAKINEQLIQIIKKIPMKFSNIQFKLKKNEVFVYEINPRISGSVGLHLHKINFPKLLIKSFLKKKLKINP